MPELIEKPTRIEAVGNKPKLIDEYIGRVNSQTEAISIAQMRSPSGWEEPEFPPLSIPTTKRDGEFCGFVNS